MLYYNLLNIHLSLLLIIELKLVILSFLEGVFQSMFIEFFFLPLI